MTLRDVQRILAPLQRRVMLMFSRAVIHDTDDAPKCQEAQVSLLAGEARARVERFQEYGFSSRPQNGAEAAMVFVGGGRDHGIIVATEDRRYRVTGLERGEVAIYTDEGDSIILRRGRLVEVTTQTYRLNCQRCEINASEGVDLNTPTVAASNHVTAGQEITDRLESGGRSMASMREIYDRHVHPENDNGGPTDEPTEAM